MKTLKSDDSYTLLVRRHRPLRQHPSKVRSRFSAVHTFKMVLSPAPFFMFKRGALVSARYAFGPLPKLTFPQTCSLASTVGFRSPQEPPRSPGAQGGPRRSQEAPGSPRSRRPQEAPGGARRPQEPPGGPGRPQEAPGRPNTAREARGGPRRPQEASRALRRLQGPANPRRPHGATTAIRRP